MLPYFIIIRKLNGGMKMRTKTEFESDVLLSEMKCSYCSHKWIPRVMKPKVCPNCKHKIKYKGDKR